MKPLAPLFVLGIAATVASVHFPRRSVVELQESELRTYMGVIAHDSMEGRPTGSLALEKVSAYITNELRQSGVAPAGDTGSYFQSVPLVRMQVDGSQSFIRINRQTGHFDVDFLPIVGVFGLNARRSARVSERNKVHGGRLGTTNVIKPADAANKVVFFYPPFRSNGQPDYQLWSVRDQLLQYRDASAIGIISLHLAPQAFRDRLTQPQWILRDSIAAQPDMPPMFTMTYFVEDWWVGIGGPTEFARDTAMIVPGLTKSELTFVSRTLTPVRPTRNIMAKIEGSDPRLRSEYVVMSAHIDHLGIASERDRVGSDSIFNGANDGSGAAALIAIAKAMQASPEKPKRSILFVWTVGEEQGFLGSQYFVNHPPASRDSIVANLTLDLIGGVSGDRVTLYGAERGSGLFASVVEDVNRASANPLVLDRNAAGKESPDSARCSGDDWHFARWGIPSLRFSTEPGPDFHRVTDEITQIDFSRLIRAATFAADVAIQIANRPAALPRTTPTPLRACVG